MKKSILTGIFMVIINSLNLDNYLCTDEFICEFPENWDLIMDYC